jgi:hypothetical protein
MMAKSRESQDKCIHFTFFTTVQRKADYIIHSERNSPFSDPDPFDLNGVFKNRSYLKKPDHLVKIL